MYLTEDLTTTDFNFRLEELEPRFLPDLRAELEAAGVDLTSKPGPHDALKPRPLSEQDR